MSLHHLDLTTALRPSLLTDETLLFVQDGVGLYEGKYKILHFQHGQLYLTSHRACYVDNEEPRKYSVAINLKDVDRYEFYAGFLKSSPKITLHLKPPKRLSTGFPSSLASGGDAQSRSTSRSGGASPAPASPSPGIVTPPSSATWICPICSFSNPVPSNLDPTTASSKTPIPSCLSCGIKPSRLHVLKAAIGASQRPTPSSSRPTENELPPRPATTTTAGTESPAEDGVDEAPLLAQPVPHSAKGLLACPVCTYLNHPSLSTCEMCGGLLKSKSVSRGTLELPDRFESPGPSLSTPANIEGETPDNIKLSFRSGGEKTFYERLKGAMVQRKWLLEGAPSLPKPSLHAPSDSPYSPTSGPYTHPSDSTPKIVGIAALEARGLETRKKNTLAISSAFSDLEALMTSAKEIIALAESFSSHLPPSSSASSPSADASRILAHSTTALGLVTTKDTLSASSSTSADNSLYHSLLSRTLTDLLTDDTTGLLKREGGIISLVDLWAVFNRARGGVELVSPADFLRACELFERLKLPVRLRRFKSGLLAVQGSDMQDEKVVARLQGWLEAPKADAETLQLQFGRGVTPREAAERFGWSVGVAREELEMAEERGVVCREEGVGGVRFWINWIVRLKEESEA